MSTRKGRGCVSENVVVARSPITPAAPVQVVAGWEVSGARSDAALTIADSTPLAKVQVRAPHNGALAKVLGVPFGRAARDAGELLIGSAPGQWLVLAPPGAAAGVARRLETIAADSAPEEFVTVTDLTHGRALVRLTGERAPNLLARLCPADLHDDMAPDGAAFRTPVAGLATDLVRDDHAGMISYLLHCERSSGQYLFDTLVAAGEPFGIGVSGFVLSGI
jgi:heterotetrameric sarcosine oxidase gamma subunit